MRQTRSGSRNASGGRWAWGMGLGAWGRNRTVWAFGGTLLVQPQRSDMPEPRSREIDKRVLKIAVIAVAIIEAMAMIPLIIHLADK